VVLLEFVFNTFELVLIIKNLEESVNTINNSFFIKILRIFTRFNFFYSRRVKTASSLYVGNNEESRSKIIYIFGDIFYYYIFCRLNFVYITEIN